MLHVSQYTKYAKSKNWKKIGQHSSLRNMPDQTEGREKASGAGSIYII
jgi:hypothetical protein